jgi:predicted metal-dependent hydrolase
MTGRGLDAVSGEPSPPLPAVDLRVDLALDPRFIAAVALFNAAAWYPCHDGFEELWQENLGPDRVVIQALLQIAVAHLHLERGNAHGATVLLGEGLGRLAPFPDSTLGLDLGPLRAQVNARLRCLQQNGDPSGLPLPALSLVR